MNDEQSILNSLCASWGITNNEIVDTANRFFNESKRLEKLTEKQEKQILNLTMKSILSPGMEQKLYFIKSDAAAPTFYFSFVPQYAAKLKEMGRGVVFLGETFVFGLIGDKPNADLLKALEGTCKQMSKKEVKLNSKNQVKFDFKIKGQKPVVTKDVCQFNMTGSDFKVDAVAKVLLEYGYIELE